MTTTGKFFGAPGCPVTEGLNKKFAVTDEDIRAASAETGRLARELDITNADHIALWLEANMADSSLAWLACRIVEAHEAALSKPTPVEAEIASLKQRLESAEEALRPFAVAADDLDDDHKDGADIWEASASLDITAGDLRRARTFLQEQEKQNG